MCSVSSGKDESQSVFSILRVEDAISMRIAFTTFVGQPYTYSFDLHHTATRSLRLQAFSQWGVDDLFPEVFPFQMMRLTSVRFPFTNIPCVLEDGRGVHLRSHWLSPFWYGLSSFFVGLLSTWFCLQAIILISASTNVSNLFFVYAITFIMSTWLSSSFSFIVYIVNNVDS